MTLPVTTPCAHNFCKACLEAKFAGKTLVRERSRGGRTLRAQKNVMNCPCCPTDISDFLQNPQVNREVMEVIERLKNQEEDDAEPVDEGEGSGTDPEEETQVVSEEAEQPKKRIKLDTDVAVSATVV
ncbi:PREDICTED: E3 ubiquitin-protein ligase ORTHRUS 2-like [Camelina sativa]|uniref:RING-type E3 ubiquitin transferase n=1 Tax=Camelina sativa TaxID=90675 RepID=A0ABM0Z745_CAMSA|nr:PREDICTED: E3 ubiquitin-protein ligase ORTHRUS 2-like [Camelina sativa]